MSMQSQKHKTPDVPRPAQEQLIGVLILAFGIACLLGVGTLAWFKFYAPKSPPTAPVSAPAQPEARAATLTAPASSPRTQLPQNQKNLVKPRLQDIQGVWKTTVNEGTATLVLVKNAFRITYTNDKAGLSRKYSSGHYTYDEKMGLLNLKPSRDFAVPKPIPGVEYKILTMRYFDVLLLKEKKNNNIFWLPKQEDLVRRRIHPLFFYNRTQEVPVLKWEKTK